MKPMFISELLYYLCVCVPTLVFISLWGHHLSKSHYDDPLQKWDYKAKDSHTFEGYNPVRWSALIAKGHGSRVERTFTTRKTSVCVCV